MPTVSRIVPVTPALHGNIYNAGQAMGGLLELVNVVRQPSRSAVLQQVTMLYTGALSLVDFAIVLLNEDLSVNDGDNFSIQTAHYAKYAGQVIIPSADWKTYNNTSMVTARNLGMVWQNQKNAGIYSLKNKSLFAVLLPQTNTPAYVNGTIHINFGLLLDV